MKMTQPLVQLVPFAGIMVTLRFLLIASLRVNVTAERKSFDVVLRRYRDMNVVKLGTAMVSKIATKAKTINSSISVKPLTARLI